MALPASGRMRQGADVNVELGISATTQISLGATGVRTLYGVASGAIRLAADGYGKTLASVWSIVASPTTINEDGSSITFSWTTTNVANGTYYWTINGAQGGDIVSGFSSGTFTKTGDNGSIVIGVAADLVTEGTETFYMEVRTGSISGTIVGTSNTVTVSDTSITAGASGASGASGAGGGLFNYSTASGDITGGTITNFGSYFSIAIGTNSTVVRDALIATTAGTNLNVTASSGLSPSPAPFTAYSAGGLVAGNNGPTAGGMFGAFIYAQNMSAMVTYGNTVIAINNSPAAVSYNLTSSMIMANSFTLYFVSTIDADAAATAMTSGKTFTLWDASGGKYTGTLSSMPGSHSPGSNTVYHAFSSTPSYMMDMSGITNRVTIG